MKIVITAEVNENSRVPQWLVEAIRHAERTGQKISIVAGKKKVVDK